MIKSHGIFCSHFSTKDLIERPSLILDITDLNFFLKWEASKIYIAMSWSNFHDNRLKLWTNLLKVVVVEIEVVGRCFLSALCGVCMSLFQQIYLHKLCTWPCWFSIVDHKHTAGASFPTALDSSTHTCWVSFLWKRPLSGDYFISHKKKKLKTSFL